MKSNGEFSIGIGYNYKKFGIGLKLNTGRNMLSNYTYLTADFKSVSANISYRVF